MRKFILKILAFILLVVLAEQIIKLYFPFYHGNEIIEEKIELIEQNKSDCNLIFIGSSRTHRQINPHIVDSIYNRTNTPESIKSFNLGSPATFCPESYYIAENLLKKIKKEKNWNIKYVVIEMNDIFPVPLKNLKSPRSYYWLDFKNFKLVYLHTMVLNKSLLGKAVTTSINFTAFSLNLVNWGHFGKNIFFTKNDYDNKIATKAGFLSLEDEFNLSNDLKKKEDIFSKRKNLLKDTSSLSIRANQSIKNFNTKTRYDKVHYEKIKQLIRDFEAHSIRIVFLLPPRYTSAEATSLYKQIPKKNKIELNNARIYPQFYQFNYSYDVGHLNNAGVEIYSKHLGLKLIQIIN